MFFMFALGAIFAIIVVYWLSNMFEKLYNDKELDAENLVTEENTDTGNDTFKTFFL